MTKNADEQCDDGQNRKLGIGVKGRGDVAAGWVTPAHEWYGLN
jgi:hypothetical protein